MPTYTPRRPVMMLDVAATASTWSAISGCAETTLAAAAAIIEPDPTPANNEVYRAYDARRAQADLSVSATVMSCLSMS